MAKQVNSRMRQKCDTLENWGKAPGFWPLEGEIIIISDAFGTGYPGIKVGDDKQTLLSELEYVHGEREIVSVTRNQEDTGYTVLLSNGEKFTLLDGADGQPGTSVTITSVNQSTSPGGVSTVTFSDGKTLSIYNGKDGAPGEGGGSVDLTNIDVIGQGGSTLISENVAAFGQLNTVGQKCFNIIIPEGSNAYDSEDEKTYAILPQEWIDGNYYILDSVEGLEVGDVFSIRLDAHSYNHGAITSIDPQTNKVVVDPFYNETYVKNTPYLWILNKPQVGTKDLGIAAFAAGVENKSQGYNSAAFGGYNNAYGWYSVAFGRENEVGYSGVGFGFNNKVNGTSGVAGGYGNIINAYAGVGFGVRNEITGAAGFATGADNKVFARAAVSLGDNNINNAESAVICGHDNKNITTALYSATFGQENTNKGQGALICGKLCTTNEHLSAALGEGIITNARAQVAVGKFNAIRTGSIFLVGTGSSDSERRTSFEVLTGGDTRIHSRLELRNADNTDYHIAFFYATDDVLPGLFNESSNTIYGKLHMPKGKIVSQYVKCDKLQLGDKVIGGVWTPNSNGY